MYIYQIMMMNDLNFYVLYISYTPVKIDNFLFKLS